MTRGTVVVFTKSLPYIPNRFFHIFVKNGSISPLGPQIQTPKADHICGVHVDQLLSGQVVHRQREGRRVNVLNDGIPPTAGVRHTPHLDLLACETIHLVFASVPDEHLMHLPLEQIRQNQQRPLSHSMPDAMDEVVLKRTFIVLFNSWM